MTVSSAIGKSLFPVVCRRVECHFPPKVIFDSVISQSAKDKYIVLFDASLVMLLNHDGRAVNPFPEIRMSQGKGHSNRTNMIFKYFRPSIIARIVCLLKPFGISVECSPYFAMILSRVTLPSLTSGVGAGRSGKSFLLFRHANLPKMIVVPALRISSVVTQLFDPIPLLFLASITRCHDSMISALFNSRLSPKNILCLFEAYLKSYGYSERRHFL